MYNIHYQQNVHGLTLDTSSVLGGYLGVNGFRVTWLITLSCPGNAETSKSRSKVSREAKTSLTPGHFSNQKTATQLLECQSFITQNTLMVGIGGKLVWFGIFFFTIPSPKIYFNLNYFYLQRPKI